MIHDRQAYEAAMSSEDGKLGIADRLRDSATLIRDQIGGEEGGAVFLDLDLLADEIEEMESSFGDDVYRGKDSFLSFQEDPQVLADMSKQFLSRVISSVGTPGKNRQQANKK